MNRPNILWYCTDQQRFDTIRSLGNAHINTPNIDRLAEMGTAFTRCYTQSPICTPSRASFLTGRYPASHHVHRNGNDSFPQSEVLVTKILADAGYDCGLAGKLHISRAKGRIERRTDDGYRVFHWSHHPKPDWPEGHGYADWLQKEKNVDPHELFEPVRYINYGEGVPEEYHQSTWCTEKTIEFITEKRDGPWLMSVNPFDPHPPFDPPKSYLSRYDPEKLPYPLFKESDIDHQKAFVAIDQQTRKAVNPHDMQAAPKSSMGSGEGDTASLPPDLYDPRTIRAAYYAMIELLDTQFGRILDTLEDTGQLQNTIIIFTSDHGELLGDHGLLYKGCRFYEALVHVPLIIVWPEKWQKNRRSKGLVELVDLAPTILEAAGVAIPESMQGLSLGGILDGSKDPDTHKQHVISEYYDAIDHPDGTHASMCFDGRYKSIVYHGHNRGELYDLKKDPEEYCDLWDKKEAQEVKLASLHRHLDAMMQTSSPGIQRTGSY